MTPPRTEGGDRLLASLPAVYRQFDVEAGGTLRHLLAAFEGVLLASGDAAERPGYEQVIDALPDLIAPTRRDASFDAATQDAFVPWLAARWVAFAPFAHFEADRLGRIVGGIVPLYGRRGTPGYLLALLRLCFDEIETIALREHLRGGVRVGQAHLGRSTRLGRALPFSFELDITLRPQVDPGDAQAMEPLRNAIRAVVDFAKPAHTACDISFEPQPDERDRTASPFS